VKAFLKSGILGEDGERGTRTPALLRAASFHPCSANIALSVLDEHFAS
jgi:hypothetical protein